MPPPNKPPRQAARRAPVPVLLLSGVSYSCFVAIGLRIFTMPWANPIDDDTARIAARAIPAFTLQYVVESMVAKYTGIVTLYTWHPDEVWQHHMASAALLLPLLLLHAWVPDEWLHFVQHHTPLVAVVASGFLTGFNESLFVLRSLVPSAIADSVVVRKGQRVVVLVVLFINMPVMLASCAVSAAPTQFRTLATCASGQPCLFGHVRRVVTLVSYAGCAAFVLLVQSTYVTSNLRHLGLLSGAGLPPAVFEDKKEAAAAQAMLAVVPALAKSPTKPRAAAASTAKVRTSASPTRHRPKRVAGHQQAPGI